jgi:hypothetical protein
VIARMRFDATSGEEQHGDAHELDLGLAAACLHTRLPRPRGVIC